MLNKRMIFKNGSIKKDLTRQAVVSFSTRAQDKWAKIFDADIIKFFRPIPGEEARPATLDDILTEMRAINSKLDRLIEPTQIIIMREKI